MAWIDGTAMHTSISKTWLILVACVARCAMSTPFSTCTVDPVEIGHPAVVICSFQVDIRTDRTSIVAYHTKINATEPVNIARCGWKGDDVGYKCEIGNGFLHDGEVSDKLRLTIKQADEDAKGKYICQKSPSKPFESTGCTLFLSDTPVVSTPSKTTTIGPTNTPRVSRGSWQRGSRRSSPAVIVPATVIPLVLAGLIIVGVAVFLIRRRKKRRHGNIYNPAVSRDEVT